MKTSKPSTRSFRPFVNVFRVQVRQLIAWGYEDVCRKARCNNEEEPAITGFIIEAINDLFRASNCPRWSVHYSVHEDPPVEKEGVSGKSRPRPDIIIEANFEGRPQYIFEAKRLRKGGYGAGKYVGPDGMGCFISGLYASRYLEAAMLGYVQSDSLVHWKDVIKKAIDKRGSSLRLVSPQRDVIVIDAFPLEWCSEHQRDKVGHPITIYHLLLDCCN
jgi:hypothetical protein